MKSFILTLMIIEKMRILFLMMIWENYERSPPQSWSLSLSSEPETETE